ncbi:MAG TPA: DUF1127 domain-containing protein [Modicisalibacter sp.]|nr:DUF1127 domain-containing protein [Modicisalibacter sp.]
MLLARFTRLLVTLSQYQKRHCSRQRLLTLSDHQLKDIGLTRADVQRETSKSFWKT